MNSPPLFECQGGHQASGRVVAPAIGLPADPGEVIPSGGGAGTDRHPALAHVSHCLREGQGAIHGGWWTRPGGVGQHQPLRRDLLMAHPQVRVFRRSRRSPVRRIQIDLHGLPDPGVGVPWEGLRGGFLPSCWHSCGWRSAVGKRAPPCPLSPTVTIERPSPFQCKDLPANRPESGTLHGPVRLFSTDRKTRM